MKKEEKQITQIDRQKMLAIREILNRDWNPIGITNLDPLTDDEYEGYAKYICLREWTQEKLFAYLIHTATHVIGLSANQILIDDSNRAVTKLWALVDKE